MGIRSDNILLFKYNDEANQAKDYGLVIYMCVKDMYD